MKNILLILFVFTQSIIYSQTTPTGNSTEVGLTAGQLNVSLTGSANYTIPIAVPPGINGVEPKINLSYSSQSGNGVAGYGWNIGGLSTISTISSTKFHDGVTAPLSRFSLDGQRLMLIPSAGLNSTYGANQSSYETETFSNLKITKQYNSLIEGQYFPEYFTVEYPDGSIAYYGRPYVNANLTNYTWVLAYWKNPQGIKIVYSYNIEGNNFQINSIKYGGLQNSTPMNEVQFIYKNKERKEQYYIGSYSVSVTKVLSEIKVVGNGVGFRNYSLEHDIVNSYERLKSITEKSGDNSKSYNPTVFEYDITVNKPAVNLYLDNKINTNNCANIQGDFDGDGKTDFIYYQKNSGVGTNDYSKYVIYKNLKPSIVNTGIEVPCPFYNSSSSIFNPLPTTTLSEIFPSKILSGNLSQGYKINNADAWTIIKNDLDHTNGLSKNTMYISIIKLTGNDNNTVSYDYGKVVQVDKYPESGNNKYTISRSTYGDFNGDGITDVIAFYNDYSPFGQKYAPTDVYFINLKKDLVSNFYYKVATLPFVIDQSSKLEVLDFNGDGKSDLSINGYVYTLNDSNNFILSPFNNTNIINQSLAPVTSTLWLYGDYNGDGKIDIARPSVAGQDIWNFSISNGSGFVSNTMAIGSVYKDIISTKITEESEYGGVLINPRKKYTYDIVETHYTANDFNGDGKTDIVCHQNIIRDYIINFDGSTDYSSSGTVISSNIKLFNNKSATVSNISFVAENSINVQPLSTFGFTSMSTNLISGSNNSNYTYIKSNVIYNSNTTMDSPSNFLLKKITTGNGVSESITYKPLKPESIFSSIYTVANNINYPNVEILNAPDYKVVSMLEQKSATTYKKQLFGYHSAVSNTEGLGFLGFKSVMRTNWFENDSEIISSVSGFNFELRGANDENFTTLGLVPAGLTILSSSTYITITNMLRLNYNTAVDALQYNKVFKLKNTSTYSTDRVSGVTSNVSYIYDSYNNPTTTTITKSNINSQSPTQTKVINMTYGNQLLGVYNSSQYYVGRPLTKKESITSYGDTKTREENYTYSNHLLTEIAKKGNLTDFITEKNQYDTFGNIITKTIVVANSTIAPRVTTFKYDISGRFLSESTDTKGLKLKYFYNVNNGRLDSEMNPYGFTTQYIYDVWGKKIKITDYLNNNTNITYTKPEATTTLITTTNDEGSVAIVKYDDLGREIVSGSKNIDDTWSYIKTEYDIYDRKIAIGEPVNNITDVPQQFTKNTFDIYGRPITNTSHTGKVTTISYTGLTNTANDGTKIITTVKDATGNTISSTDNGGTINYTYFADGNLKTSNFDGTIISTEYDGWGRKTKLTDPSAGIYTYQYNALGEIIKESTPKGITTFTINDIGQVTEKTIVGDLTNSKTTYTYDPISKLLLSSSFANILEGNTTTNTFEYDNYKRVFKTHEILPYIEFHKEFTFDGFGRIDTETYKGVGQLLHTKKVQHKYKNGEHYQILDNATQQLLWETNTVNARGQLLTGAYGNNIKIKNTYNTYGFIEQMNHSRFKKAGVFVDIMTLNTGFDIQKANLNSRTNSLFNTNETFVYDNLDRLTEFTNNQGLQETQAYDNKGRITQNNLGTYNYTKTDKKYQNTSIDVTPQTSAYYEGREGIYSDSFDQQQKWGKDKYPAGQNFVSYDNYIFRSGRTSLKLANTQPTEQLVYADEWIELNNATDTQYTFSTWVYSDAPQSTLLLLMKTANETAYFSSYDYVTASGTNDWVLLTKTITIPANIKRIRLRLGSNGVGNVWFDDVKIIKNGNATSLRELNITYNTFKSPVQIEETGIDKISYTYNDSNDRSCMFYGGLENDKLLRPLRKYYSGDGSMELKHNTATGAVEFIAYIGGDAYSAPIVYKSDDVVKEYLYLHRDYQGSIIAITNQSGNIVEKRLFDAWGNIVNVQDGQNNILCSFALLDRGYTGHEHLQTVGIIHMNGRLYDPKLHRFLQPDNNIQDPFNTQNYNRYGYVMNNPLKYSDKTGEFWGFVAAFLFSTYIHGAQATGQANPTKWNAGQFLNAGLGASSTFISSVATNYSNKLIENSWVNNNINVSSINGGIRENELNYHTYVENLNKAKYDNSMFGYAGVVSVALLSDDITGVGVIDDIAIPFVWGASAGYWGFKNRFAIKQSVVDGVNDVKLALNITTNYVDKMNREMSRIYERAAGPPGFVYELRAVKNGYYPNRNTGGTTYLNGGEVWKYGVTTKGGGRYPDKNIDLKRDGLIMVPIFYGNQMEILIQEKIMIYGYYFMNGSRPAGNPIFR